MARNCVQGRGSSRPRSCASPSQPFPVDSVSMRRVLVLAAALFALCLGVKLPMWAQDGGGTDDVHITPRREAVAPKSMDTVDPALKTHTRPYVKDVDLVLVPVTITDPLNRLVTGLDRQNFAVFEGKEQQE